jgi:hypothetical protein
MKKIYYLKESEVIIGDKITLNGMTITLTQQIIDDLPHMFKIKEDSVPEYVKCVKLVNGNSWPKVGEILPVTKPDCNGQQSINGVCLVGGVSNKKCFKPSTKKDYLLQEVEKYYPIGVRINSIFGCTNYLITGELLLKYPINVNTDRDDICGY